MRNRNQRGEIALATMLVAMWVAGLFGAFAHEVIDRKMDSYYAGDREMFQQVVMANPGELEAVCKEARP